jgi:hypothetical protein
MLFEAVIPDALPRACVVWLLGAGLLPACWGALAVDRMALHQFEDGPMLGSNYEFLPGETAYFSCRLAGFQTFVKDKDREDNRTVKLAWDLRVTDPAGILIDKPAQGRIEAELVREDKNWIPKFLVSFVIPPFAPGGSYRITAHIRDEVASQEITGTLELRVRGHAVEPSDTIAAHNFRFLRAEDDSGGLTSPIYRPGDTLWARFDIIGFKLGDGNKYTVDYGLAIENPDGKQLFSQPEAAEDNGESFYPKRYIPGVLSLHLDATVAKGAYVLVVILRDQIGQQLKEERQPFQIE